MRGVKGLMIAVLDEAMNSLALVRQTHNSKMRTRGLSAIRWVKSPDASHPFSFVSICDALGLEPERIRRQILADAEREVPVAAHRPRVDRRVETNLPKISSGRRRSKPAQAKNVA
ncbi:MAG: hypothetical protein WCH13_04995 [Deltaproteobacteria bacterium]